MKKLAYLFFFLALFTSNAQNLSETNAFKTYWYAGKAEITSYNLEQARYGEIRNGHAVMIFVTEPFSKKHNTKADKNHSENTTVLKLNTTKKFNTGIYPYSIMTSTFVPVKNPKASLKISSSSQEWCGHEYIELTNKNNAYILHNFSYFQGESFTNKKISKNVILEDDIWSKIRLSPSTLPLGDFKALPSFVWLRFSHKEVTPYSATGTLKKGTEENTYTIHYPTLDRTLEIVFQSSFPFQITRFTETFYSGWGAKRKQMTSKATLKKTINIPYWQTNSNKDLYLRNELGIE
ncbi:hypothetical protein [Ochrovirga pacifica]|uniref:hypothetical protein n=1 Tax=Ochrovirga pacifica TaxID=1042376 RepID=UPI0002559531|nr:hypothetical protein [Ochrovirga pacifica]